MNCDEAQDRIGAWIDRQLDADETAALESHLSVCGECRAASEAERTQDADLLRAFGPHREAAHRVADRVIDTWKVQSTDVAPPVRRIGRRWGSLALAAAAGFLLAVLMFQPWKENVPMVKNPTGSANDSPSVNSPPKPPIPSVQATVASLVVATGSVEVREQGADAWQVYADSADFRCAFGGMVKTGPNVCCELKTSDGCVIRLNADTEIKLTSASALEVQRGEVWCSAPENVSLKVSASKASEPPPPAAAQEMLWMLVCPSESRLMAVVRRDGSVRVTAANGEIELQTPTGRDWLRRGETATFVGGQFVKEQPSTDPLLAASWMHPLLIRKGHADKELAGRVDELIARLGRSKLTLLYEQEIRSLGGHAVLPLLRYVQSPLFQDEPPRRRTAMRILSDIAPSWTVSDLIELLCDNDANTRYLAAKALHRLTGLDHGRPADKWREALIQCQPSIETWQQWWAKNCKRYPSPSDARSV